MGAFSLAANHITRQLILVSVISNQHYSCNHYEKFATSILHQYKQLSNCFVYIHKSSFKWLWAVYPI